MFHPWRRLRSRPQIDVSWPVLPGRLGETDGITVIRLHPHQSQVQRRCTLAHELAHIELGHVDGCSAVEEEQAARLAARWLIAVEHLAEALAWSQHVHEVADVLWVDVPTLEARMRHLHPSEHHYLTRRLAAKEDPC